MLNLDLFSLDFKLFSITKSQESHLLEYVTLVFTIICIHHEEKQIGQKKIENI